MEKGYKKYLQKTAPCLLAKMLARWGNEQQKPWTGDPTRTTSTLGTRISTAGEEKVQKPTRSGVEEIPRAKLSAQPPKSEVESKP